MRAEVHREIGRLIGHARRICALAINQRLAPVDSNIHEFSVLAVLAEEGETAQHELAFDAGMDPAALSRLVRDMVAQGTVTTRVDPGDKRLRVVNITRKGEKRHEALSPIVDSTLEPYMVGLDDEELETFIRLLRKSHAVMIEVASGKGPLNSESPAPIDGVVAAKKVVRKKSADKAAPKAAKRAHKVESKRK